jgi:hypothetical protein
VFRAIKQQFGYFKVRYQGLAKNAAQVKVLAALIYPCLLRGRLMAAWTEACPMPGKPGRSGGLWAETVAIDTAH